MLPWNVCSDHCAVEYIINIKKENIISETKTFRNLKNLDIEMLTDSISNIDLTVSDQVDTIVELFGKEVGNILDENVPEITRTVIHRKPKPWFNETIKSLKRELRRKEYVWRRYQQSHQWIALKKVRNKYVFEINRSKQENLTDLVFECKGDSKKLYNLVSKLTGTMKENSLPESENDIKLANDFEDYFLKKIQNIRDALADVTNYSPEELIPLLAEFEPLSENKVKNIINKLGTKSYELDIIPTSLLKKCLSGLLPSVTKVVNISLSTGTFSENYKEAIIRPLLKKTGLELLCSNYRPVSNLSFMSKVIEKAMLLRFNKHCDDFGLTS